MASETTEYEFTISHQFKPGDKVWVIMNQAAEFQKTSHYSRSGYPPRTECAGIRKGKVVYFRADVLLTETKMWYGINIDGTDTTRDFHIEDVFGSFAEAMIDYEERLTGGVKVTLPSVIQYAYESKQPVSDHYVRHNLGTTEVVVSVYDFNNKKVFPNEIEILDENSIIVSLGNAKEGIKVNVLGNVDTSDEWTKKHSNDKKYLTRG